MNLINERNKKKVYIIWKTVHEMLEDRGYQSNAKLSYEKFLDKYFDDNVDSLPNYNKMTFVTSSKKDPLNEIIIYFLEEDTIGIKTTIKIYNDMCKKKIMNGILIFKNSITFSAKKYILNQKDIRIELFLQDNFIINVTKHVSSPQFQILSPQEKDKLLKLYHIEDSKLPRILKTDPVAKYYGLKKGDVLRILRKSKTSGIYVTYRILL